MPTPETNRILAENLAHEEAFQEDLRHGFKQRIHKMLYEDIQIPPRHQKAVAASVPHEIVSVEGYKDFPSKSFGLVGDGGCGKSCAISSLIQTTLRKDLEAAGPVRIEEMARKDTRVGQPFQGTRTINPEPFTQFKWIGWPAYSVRMKNYASRREWDHPESSVMSLVQWVQCDPERRVLILDDLGMENVRSDSYTTEQLELLIDEIYNWEGRLFWTSNRGPEHLAKPEVYGYRLMSRLMGLSPARILPLGMPDLRNRS
jgi:hypothetical protein